MGCNLSSNTYQFGDDLIWSRATGAWQWTPRRLSPSQLLRHRLSPPWSRMRPMPRPGMKRPKLTTSPAQASVSLPNKMSHWGRAWHGDSWKGKMCCARGAWTISSQGWFLRKVATIAFTASCPGKEHEYHDSLAWKCDEWMRFYQQAAPILTFHLEGRLPGTIALTLRCLDHVLPCQKSESS